MTADPETLEWLLTAHRAELMAFVRREARGLLRFESEEDLVQGVLVRILGDASGFTYQGEREFLAWSKGAARRHIADRHDYWSALKRGSGKVLRYTSSGSHTGDPLAVALPAGTATGPGKFASRREMLVLATRALSMLPERDRKLIRWASEGVELRDQGERLGLGYAAVQRASLRALQRFEKAFRLLAR